MWTITPRRQEVLCSNQETKATRIQGERGPYCCLALLSPRQSPLAPSCPARLHFPGTSQHRLSASSAPARSKRPLGRSWSYSMKRGGDSLSHCEGGEERARRERRKPEKRIRRKSILLMLKKSNDTLPRPSPPFPWGKNQKVLPSHSCKSENVPSRWLLGTGASCCPGLDRKGAALAKRQNKTAKQPTTKALSDQQ